MKYTIALLIGAVSASHPRGKMFAKKNLVNMQYSHYEPNMNSNPQANNNPLRDPYDRYDREDMSPGCAQ